MTRGRAQQAKSNPADEGSLGQHTAQPKGTNALSCPSLTYGLRPQRQGRAEVFFSNAGNLRREKICSHVKSRAQTVQLRNGVVRSGKQGSTGFKKEGVSLAPVEGRQEDTGRLTYGMLGTGLSIFS